MTHESTILTTRLAESYRQHASDLVEHCRKEMGNKEEAQDIVQETFLRAWEQIYIGNSLGNFRTFLYRTANHIIALEKKKRLQREDIPIEDIHEDSERVTQEEMDRMQKRLEVRNLLLKLKKKKDYKLLVMRYIDGFLLEDIASEMGLAPNTVAVRLHRAVRGLSRELVLSQKFLSISPANARRKKW